MVIKEYLNNYKHIFFIGIGGVSMSALAKLCLSCGIKVSGSDTSQTSITKELSRLGVKVFYKHNKENIKDVDMVVYTCAVGKENCELIEAQNKNIKIFERVEFLQNILNCYNNIIAVAGSHGKTTTTAMIGNIFLRAKLNPTIHIGGNCANFNGNLKIGGNQYFIVEACEYQKHLLKINHNVGVVVNIELDHAECYNGFEDFVDVFNKFKENSREKTIVNEKYLSLIKNKKNVISFSEAQNGNFYAKNINIKLGNLHFDCYKNEDFFGHIVLKIFGKHNVYNALSAIAVADYYGISYKNIFNGLITFKGIKRRFEYVGKINNQIVIHDYSHHPTEIVSAITTAKEYFKTKILVVFQPHTYSRTKYLFKDFIKSLTCADDVIILPTYPARETKKDGYTAKHLYNYLKNINKGTKYINSFKKVKDYLNNVENHTILILGAGNIEMLAKDIKKDYILKK